MKRLFSFISVVYIFSASALAQMYVSPTGSDSNPGTLDLPFRNLSKAISLTGPDSIIYMRGGVYNDSVTIRLNKTGQADKLIKIWAYPGEHPIIDFSNQPISTSSRGIQISQNYWHLKGIEIRNAGDNGIHISSWYNIVENCVIHHCEDTGLQISGGGSYNVIINCDSYENVDFITAGENADGFAPKLDIGPGNIFKGCRAWSNADDGWDMYESNDPVILEDCWAFQNGYNIWGIPSFQGDGNGFKLGGNYFAGPHKVIKCVAFDNKAKGFDQNNNIAGITLYNNTAYRNGSSNFAFATTPSIGVHELKNNISYLKSNSFAPNSIASNNSWQGFTVSDLDFISLDTALSKMARDDSGYLPEFNLFRLASTSLMINAGVDVGLPFNGIAPDLGAFETGSIIPVELISFNASISQNSILLSWETTSELNNLGFEVQKQFEGRDFVTIGSVKGSGTTTKKNVYHFTDNNAVKGVNRYRLKQIDYSGKYDYSNEVQINFSIPGEFTLLQNYPNPFNPSTKIIYLLDSPGDVVLQIFNYLGEEVNELVHEYQNAGSHEINWIAEDQSYQTLPSGIYIAKLSVNNRSVSIKIFLIK